MKLTSAHLSIASLLLLLACPTHTAAAAAPAVDERRTADDGGGPIDALKQQFEEFLAALEVPQQDNQPQEQAHDTAAAGEDSEQDERKRAARLTVDKVRKAVSKLKKGRLAKTTREQSPYSPEFIAGADAFVAEVNASIAAFQAAFGAEIGDEISVLLVSIEEDLEAIEVLAATGGVDVVVRGIGDLDAIDLEAQADLEAQTDRPDAISAAAAATGPRRELLGGGRAGRPLQKPSGS
ncbi:unnamed protein product [Vitrella brassicaformis CCMP3155]|uniref:Uncharacterized protein n=1 Tax=Vitrella brassicaformis (strain CCMP3155) TaxID=1169540 RepID=A0A0G4FWX1_VITBC|nr:unnamed protein product [Vitrella brassicaformis CCMP3155]|eukprot:CEM19446.1 unnamed protein product [Vitrella brassicaformis CCMP3155]